MNYARALSLLLDLDGAPARLPAPFPYDRAGYLKARKLVSKPARREATRKAPIVRVSLTGLRAIQRTVTREGLRAHASGSGEGVDHGSKRLPRDLPIILQLDGARWLVDGTHRCSLALARGERTVRARVVDLDALTGGA